MQIIHTPSQPLTLPNSLMSVLPAYLSDAIRRCGASVAQEIRLHRDRYATVSLDRQNFSTRVILSATEIQEILYRMCGGSLYAFSHTINRGYLTLEGGIRVGVCGEAALEDDRIIGISNISGLVIRLPHHVEDPEAASALLSLLSNNGRGILIYAPPGIGKTTLLRCVTRMAASPTHGIRTVAVDTRRELSFALGEKDLILDILQGYPRRVGIEIAVRCLGAQLIVCDEIGSSEEAAAILQAANCGVPLIATAHASTLSELLSKPTIATLHRAHVFDSYVLLSRQGTRFHLDCVKHSDVRACQLS